VVSATRYFNRRARDAAPIGRHALSSSDRGDRRSAAPVDLLCPKSRVRMQYHKAWKRRKAARIQDGDRAACRSLVEWMTSH
jgi:hypothetical protein